MLQPISHVGAKEGAASIIAEHPRPISRQPHDHQSEGTPTRRTKPPVWAADIRRSSFDRVDAAQARARTFAAPSAVIACLPGLSLSPSLHANNDRTPLCRVLISQIAS